jgi:flagellar FliL protein
MTGKPGLDKIIIMLNLVLVLGFAGLTAYSHIGIKKPVTDEMSEAQSLVETAMRESQLSPVILPRQIVNLYSRQTRLRFLEIELGVQTFKAKQQEIIRLKQSFINDAIIEIAGNMAPEELDSVTGKLLFESRLRKRINDEINNPIIKKIYFSKFIVQ